MCVAKISIKMNHSERFRVYLAFCVNAKIRQTGKLPLCDTDFRPLSQLLQKRCMQERWSSLLIVVLGAVVLEKF